MFGRFPANFSRDDPRQLVGDGKRYTTQRTSTLPTNSKASATNKHLRTTLRFPKSSMRPRRLLEECLRAHRKLPRSSRTACTGVNEPGNHVALPFETTETQDQKLGPQPDACELGNAHINAPALYRKVPTCSYPTPTPKKDRKPWLQPTEKERGLCQSAAPQNQVLMTIP